MKKRAKKQGSDKKIFKNISPSIYIDAKTGENTAP